MALVFGLVPEAGAVTLTERSEAVFSAAAALRAAGQQGPALAEAVREVIAARRARDGQRLRRALDRAELLLEPTAESWDPARVDLRAWEVAEGRELGITVWRQGREFRLLDPAELDERAVYLGLRAATTIRGLGLALPPYERAAIAPVEFPPRGFAAWNFARQRLDSIAILSGRPITVIPVMDPGRPQEAEWRRALSAVGLVPGALTRDLEDVPGEWWASGGPAMLVWAGETLAFSRVLASAARVGSSSVIIVMDPRVTGLERHLATLSDLGDTPRVLGWREGAAVAVYSPRVVLVGNSSAVTLPVEILTDVIEPLGVVRDTEPSPYVASRSAQARPRFARVEVWTDEGVLQETYRIRLVARSRFQAPPASTLIVRFEAGS